MKAITVICGHKTVIISSRGPETVGKQYEEVSGSKNPDAILQVAVDYQSDDEIGRMAQSLNVSLIVDEICTASQQQMTEIARYPFVPDTVE